MSKLFDKIKSAFTSRNTVINPETIQELNPEFSTFSKLDDEDEILQHSIVTKVTDAAQSRAGYDDVNAYKMLVYGKLSIDKPRRLNFYRQMSKFPEVSDAIDEICDAFLNYDDKHNFIDIIFKHPDFTEDQREVLRKEFEKFISLFNFESDGYEIIRDYIVDGEVSWENIIDENHKDLGIIGINRIPAECYEYIVDDRYNIIGIVINAQLISDAEVQPTEADKELYGQGYNNLVLHYGYRTGAKKLIPMPINQITLINSGVYSSTKDIVYPVLEKARRAYRQLSLIEDAIIIYRLIRAPERLVFNVDTGKLPPHKAEELVLKMMKRYQNKKVYDPQSGTVGNGYDCHSMLENFWFPRSEGAAGTTVTSLATNASLGQLDDLYYFLRKLYVSLKIPYDRFQNPGQDFKKIESLNYEEYRFAKFIVRIQNQFAKGLNQSFKTHLQLMGLWDQYKLNDRSFFIKLTPPTGFDLYEQQQLIKMKLDTYKSVTERDEFSRDLCMIKYLNMTESEVEENNKKREEEMIRKAYLDRKIANIGSRGKPDEESNDDTSNMNASSTLPELPAMDFSSSTPTSTPDSSTSEMPEIPELPETGAEGGAETPSTEPTLTEPTPSPLAPTPSTTPPTATLPTGAGEPLTF